MAGIYIHIPFCKQACYYCNFYFSASTKLKSKVLDAIKREMVLRKNELNNEPIETIYFGGGTPSLLTFKEIQSLFDVIYSNFNVIKNPEITLEANPDDLTEKKLVEYSKLPINRLSIGIQSFFNDDLNFMNRAHSAEESKNCLKLAAKYFTNITIDLIYGIPNMSAKKWKTNLKTAFDFGVQHISAYALTVEEKTALHSFIKKKKIPPVDENLAFEHFNTLLKETKKHSFINYEISNFGKENFFSKHNISYWLGKKYLGIGPSSHSFNGIERKWNISSNSKYVKSLEKDILSLEIEKLTKNDKFNERIMLGLRTAWGVYLNEIESDFGDDYLQYLMENIKPFLKNKLLEIKLDKNSNKTIVITDKGKFLADGIASELFVIPRFGVTG